MQVYPRVTEILHAYSGYDKVPAEVLVKAGARGTKVHALCASIAKGNWIPQGMIEPELQGYVASFRAWSELQVDNFWIIEKRYIDDDLKYTGQLDFVISGNDNKFYLADLKTSAKRNKTYRVQIAAYHLLLEKEKQRIDGAMIVYLDKNGEFPEIDFLEDLDEEERVFKSALECWHYFHKRKESNEYRITRKA